MGDQIDVGRGKSDVFHKDDWSEWAMICKNRKEGNIEDSALGLLTSMMFELFVKVRL